MGKGYEVNDSDRLGRKGIYHATKEEKKTLLIQEYNGKLYSEECEMTPEETKKAIEVMQGYVDYSYPVAVDVELILKAIEYAKEYFNKIGE